MKVNQTRALWHAIIAGKIRASYDTLAECREAVKFGQASFGIVPTGAIRV